jgi:hypothetical protein
MSARDFEGVPDNHNVDHAPNNVYRRHADGRPSLTVELIAKIVIAQAEWYWFNTDRRR